MTPNEKDMRPECYKRHAEIDNHIIEGKGWRMAIIGILITVITQVGAFLFMWGGLTNTVNKNSSYLWGELTDSARENTRNMDRLMVKLENIKLIAVVGDQGIPVIQGEQGIQGVPGKAGKPK